MDFRVITKLNNNGNFVPVLLSRRQYLLAEETENGCQKYYHAAKEYLVENSAQFKNAKISKAGGVLVTPVFSSIDFGTFEVYFNEGYERYIEMPDRKQITLFEEYARDVDMGDILSEKYPLLIRELVRYRGDLFISDREVAAMAYAVRKMVF